MKRAPRSLQHHVLYRKYNGQDSEISALLGKCGIKLVPYWALGQFSLKNLEVAAMLMPPAALAVFAGVKLTRMVPEKLFFQVITWALLIVSMKLIYDGIKAA